MNSTERKAYREQLLAWLRTNAVASTGQALSAALDGERDLPTLYRLNMADGVQVREDTAGRPLPPQVREGDRILGVGTVLGDPTRDPETGAYWITVRRLMDDDTEGFTGDYAARGATVVEDVELDPAQPVRIAPRPRPMPPHVAEAHAEYRAARDAWENLRDAECHGHQEEEREYAVLHPAPRFEDFLSHACARQREDRESEAAKVQAATARRAEERAAAAWAEAHDAA